MRLPAPSIAMRAATLVAVAGALLLLASPSTATQEDGLATGTVLVTRVNGPITPVIADHLVDALAEASGAGHVALLVEMDTPGGLDTSMRQIVQAFLMAEVPVIVHVAPPGARAASAGSVITLSAHVAAMASGTNIGAATPISLEGGEVIDKVVEDAAAYVTAIAEARDRDVDFAVATVREGRSVSAREALELGVIDLIADNREEVLAGADGLSVNLEPRSMQVTLVTAGAIPVEFEMSSVRRLLQALADPNLAFLFISIGTLGVIYELANPGAGLGGVIGAVMLVLAFFSLSVLPMSVAGLLLLVLAAALFVAELFVPGVGVFAAGGAIALIAAGLFLFQQPTGIGIDWAVLLPVPIVVAIGAVLVGRVVVRTQRGDVPTGIVGSLEGEVGDVRQVDGDRLQVLVHGSLWSATSTGDLPAVGDRVRVVSAEGLRLLVEPHTPDAPHPPP